MGQKMLYETSMLQLVKATNRHLVKGWHIVLGSIGCGTTHRAAKRANEYETHTKDDKVFTSIFWCVVEKPTVARDDGEGDG